MKYLGLSTVEKYNPRNVDEELNMILTSLQITRIGILHILINGLCYSHFFCGLQTLGLNHICARLSNQAARQYSTSECIF